MIVGIGEILWDIYPDGRKVAGGAPFNFAFHCHQLGHPSTMVSRVGDDELGRELRARVRELGLSDEYIQTDPLLPTGTVRVTVDRGGQPAYAIDMHAAWGNLEWSPALTDLAQRAQAVCHGTLALCGGTGSRNVIHLLSLQVDRHGDLTIYDVNLRENACTHPDVSALHRSRWIKVNEDELNAINVENRRGDTVLIVTRGASGAEVVACGLTHREPAVAAKVVDTVGAGDAFTAAMVCLHLEGRLLQECLRFANSYAARVCESQGATPQIDREEVESAAFGS